MSPKSVNVKSANEMVPNWSMFGKFLILEFVDPIKLLFSGLKWEGEGTGFAKSGDQLKRLMQSNLDEKWQVRTPIGCRLDPTVFDEVRELAVAKHQVDPGGLAVRGDAGVAGNGPVDRGVLCCNIFPFA